MIPVIFFRSYGVRVFVFASAYSRLFRLICLRVTLHDSCIISQAYGWSLVVLPSCSPGQGWEGHINTQMATQTHGTQYHNTAQPHYMACLRGTGPTLSMFNCGVIYVLCEAYELLREG